MFFPWLELLEALGIVGKKIRKSIDSKDQIRLYFMRKKRKNY